MEFQHRDDHEPLGTSRDTLRDPPCADVFIGVSCPNLLVGFMVYTMKPLAIVFALSNPVPEIMPDDARTAGAAKVATGRSDFPNQVNNALAYSGIFRGALDAGAAHITEDMKRAAMLALAALVPHPTAETTIPDIFDRASSPPLQPLSEPRDCKNEPAEHRSLILRS